MFTFYIVFRHNKKLEKLQKLETLEWFLIGAWMGNPDHWRVRSANQIQGFKIPDCWEAEEKKKEYY